MTIISLFLICSVIAICGALLYKMLYKKQINKALYGRKRSFRLISPFLFLIIVLVLVSCGFIIGIYKIGLIDYWKDGAAYFVSNEKYTVESYALDKTYTFTFDPHEKDQYEGTHIIDDELFKVRVDEIRIFDGENKEDARISLYLFIESKNYDFYHGKIVAPKPEDKYGTLWMSKEEPEFDYLKLTTKVNNKYYAGSQRGEGPFVSNGIYIVVSLVDYDYRNNQEEVKLTDYNKLTVSFEDFVVNEYSRK